MRTQLIEAPFHFTRFTSMPLDCIFERQRLQIVHEPRFGAKPPKGSCPQFICGVLRSHLDNSVSRFNIVQEKIAEWMDNLIAESFGNSEHSPVDRSSGRSGRDGLHMAGTATDPREQPLALAPRPQSQPESHRVEEPSFRV